MAPDEILFWYFWSVLVTFQDYATPIGGLLLIGVVLVVWSGVALIKAAVRAALDYMGTM